MAKKRKPESPGQREAADKMINFTRRLLNVPKADVDALRKAEKKRLR